MMSDNECSLVDDEDDFSRYLGSLTFSDDKHQEEPVAQAQKKEVPVFSSSDLPKSPKAMSTNICFEVTDAKILTENKSKFVMYTILVKNSAFDLSPVSVERRYSDFERLNSDLKKMNNSVMSDIAFPRKYLIGNFKAQTIAERSRGFEQYMQHLTTLHHVHFSSPFKFFFYGVIHKEAYKLFMNKQYNDAVPLLRKVLQLQKKLYGDMYEETVNTLSVLTVCFLELDCIEKAQVCSEAATRCLKCNQDSDMLVPLLQISIRLCWKLGKDKHDLEKQLQMLQKDRLDSCSAEELRELVLKNWQKYAGFTSGVKI